MTLGAPRYRESGVVLRRGRVLIFVVVSCNNLKLVNDDEFNWSSELLQEASSHLRCQDLYTHFLYCASTHNSCIVHGR